MVRKSLMELNDTKERLQDARSPLVARRARCVSRPRYAASTTSNSFPRRYDVAADPKPLARRSKTPSPPHRPVGSHPTTFRKNSNYLPTPPPPNFDRRYLDNHDAAPCAIRTPPTWDINEVIPTISRLPPPRQRSSCSRQTHAAAPAFPDERRCWCHV